MTHIRRVPTAVLVAVALIAAAFGGALVGQINFAGADVTSGDKPVNVNVDTFRIRDTRSVFGGPIGGPAAKLGTRVTEVVQVAGTNGIPASATAVCVNVTVLDATTESFVTVYGSDPRPNASTVNPTPGGTFFNGVIVPLDSNGDLRVYNNAGSVNYFLDISCYYDDHNHDDVANERSSPLILGPADFVEDGFNNDPGYDFLWTRGSLLGINGGGCMNAPLHIPDGSTIDYMQADIVDGYDLNFYRAPFGGPGQLIVSEFGASVGPDLIDFGLANHVVDTDQFYYWVAICLGDGDELFDVEVGFTLGDASAPPSPVPLTDAGADDGANGNR